MTTHLTTTVMTDSRAKVALKWMPTFLGFPAGGLVAELTVGPVDALGPAVVGGLLTGLVLGVAQSLALRRHGVAPAAWIVATTIGAAIGIGAGAAAVDYRTSTAALAAEGAIAGAAIGVAHAVALLRRLGGLALIWPPLLSGAWALGWTITASIGVDVETQYTVFGSSGAVVVTAITSVLPLILASRPVEP